MTEPRRGGAIPRPHPADLRPDPAEPDVAHYLRLPIGNPGDPAGAPCTLDQLEAVIADARAAGVPGAATISHDRGPLDVLALDWKTPFTPGRPSRLRWPRARRG